MVMTLNYYKMYILKLKIVYFSGPPSTPVEPEIVRYNEHRVTVSWIRGFHGGYDQTFVIQYSTDYILWQDGTTKNGGLSRSTGRINATVEGLDAATHYYIRIYSYNIRGSSGYSGIVNVTTLENEGIKSLCISFQIL